MRFLLIMALLTGFIIAGSSFTSESLRRQYSRPSSAWPRPWVDAGVEWKELGILPSSPVDMRVDSLRQLARLGAMLFFDTRLSGAGRISCASCHQPEKSWTDGRSKSLGHEDQENKRNSPTILNVWGYTRLFWDGRSSGLEDQAFAPINSESEMHSDIRELPARLRKLRQYRELFDSVYPGEGIDPDKIAAALATFQRTIVSDSSAFDRFLAGDRKALDNPQLRGLHLFRTKARCMNCHHGPLLTDNQFHQTIFSGNDIGRYMQTHVDADSGRIRTPSLRDVVYTGPWMHDGKETSLAEIIRKYESQVGTDPLLHDIRLSPREKKDLLAFLQAISAPPPPFNKPVLPE